MKTIFKELVTAFRKQPCTRKIVLKVVCDCEYVSKASSDISLEKIEVKESRNRNSDAALGTSSRISKCFKEAGSDFKQFERELI